MRALLLTVLILAPLARAELPIVRLDTIFPPGGRQGTEVEVTVAGADLEEPKALRFSQPGLTATPKADHKFAVQIAADVPPGAYDVQFLGQSGLSNPRTFVVSDHAETSAAQPHASPETALPLSPGAVCNGTATAAARDYFTFPAAAGQRVLIDYAAAQLESRLRPVLTVASPHGLEVASSLRGELLDFTASEPGTYLLSLRDVAYAGGPEYAYRLTVGPGPWIDFVFPPAAPAGAKANFILYGRNLPGGVPADLTAGDGRPLEKLPITLDIPTAGTPLPNDLASPAAAALDGFTYRLPSAEGSSNPVFIGRSAGPLVAEQEPNDQPDQAQTVTPPCEIAGQFQSAADADYYRFTAAKGDVYILEITSHRRGLATNPYLLVQREKADVQEAYGPDANAGGPKFSTLANDPVCRFEAKEAGEYRVLVRDLYGGTRRDPANVYQLSIRKETPDFALTALAEPMVEKADDRTATPFASVLRAGGTIALRVVALRRDGFAGPIELRAEGLPPGITCIPTQIAAGKNEGRLLLTAVETIEPWTGALRVLGQARVGEADVVRTARGGAVVWGAKDYNAEPVRCRLTREIVLTVLGAEASPLAVAAEDKVWEAPAGGKLEIPFQVTRRGEFKDALKLKPAGLPALEAVPEIDVAPAATEVKVTLDLAALKVAPGQYTLWLQGFSKGKFRGKDASMAVYSVPTRISVTAP